MTKRKLTCAWCAWKLVFPWLGAPKLCRIKGRVKSSAKRELARVCVCFCVPEKERKRVKRENRGDLGVGGGREKGRKRKKRQ